MHMGHTNLRQGNASDVGRPALRCLSVKRSLPKSMALHPLAHVIAQGEGVTLDFKKSVPSARKIARTLCAFANTQGGRLLTGVRDNGTVAGTRPDEDLYLIELGASQFCQPQVQLQAQEHDFRGLPVLEVFVPESATKPHKALDDADHWVTYIRLADESVAASHIVAEVLRRRQQGRGGLIRYTDIERHLLTYLQQAGRITLNQLCQHLALPRRRASAILINLIAAGILEYQAGEQEEYYRLAVPLAS